MVQVALLCAIVGLPRSTFVVDIDTDRSVAHLKKDIKDENTVDVLCDARELRLFLAKKDGAWLRDDGDLDRLIQTQGILDGMEEMRASWRLRKPSLFGTGVLLGKKVVHVLVMLPPTMPGPRSEPTTVGNAHSASQLVLSMFDKLSRLLWEIFSRLPILQRDTITVGGLTIPFAPTMWKDSSLDKFWKVFRECYSDADLAAGAVIALPEETFILGNDLLGSHIYIRHCYPQLWNTCLDTFECTRHLVILGSPGIGETYFCYLILLYLARDGKTVVYETGRRKMRILFSGELVIQGSRSDFDKILDLCETFYIVDGMKPQDYKAKTILVTSPRHEIRFEFHKFDCGSFYMPVWTEEEIFQCRELMYSDRPVNDVKECFRKWGGIARYVLRYATDQDQQKSLDEAIGKVDLKALIKSHGKLSGDDKLISHRILHYRVNDDFTEQGYTFASDYVLDIIYQQLYEHNRAKLVAFLDASRGFDLYAVIRGRVFERYVHSVLPQGGNFRVRRLTVGPKHITAGVNEGERKVKRAVVDEDTKTVHLPKLKNVVFERDEQVTSADLATYLRPKASNFESVDAMATPNILFQVTCARVHPCKRKGLCRVLDLLGKPAEPRLYFVVPPDIFDDFRYQAYQHNERKKQKDEDNIVEKLEQFVMEVSYAHEIPRIKEAEGEDPMKKKVKKVQDNVTREKCGLVSE
uniref:Crinkler effector protein N-terminal domain-containing protein n=1 Tax=Peronospora matthiolae TaxID=2874970 RepID=A0AAV1TLS1_9STRA